MTDSTQKAKAAHITPPRRALLEALHDADGETTTDDLREAADIRPRTFSHHLDVLKSLSAVRVRNGGATSAGWNTGGHSSGGRTRIVELSRFGEQILDSGETHEFYEPDHPADDFAEGLEDSQRIGELEEEVLALRETIEGLRDELGGGDADE